MFLNSHENAMIETPILGEGKEKVLEQFGCFPVDVAAATWATVGQRALARAPVPVVGSRGEAVAYASLSALAKAITGSHCNGGSGRSKR